ncbi:MAG TPA: enoyl-CoA hydratase/isomerase family protein [Acidimicrobiia bacterium]|nr:enoyl-CoA hydratase/isomerase family protein [Acidimicrobiia bacterium]
METGGPAGGWLDIEDRGAVRWLTINRPARRNAIPMDGWPQLEKAFLDFDGSSSRVLVITGAGGAFCSGADLDPSRLEGQPGLEAHHRRMQQVGAAAMALHRCTKPTLAAVDGIAAGAGLNLALGCDVAIASTRGRFSEIFVRRGLTVDFGGTWLLPRVVGLQRAKELALSGRIVEASEALAIGLVLETVEVDRLEARTTELAESFLAGAPIAQMFAKQGLDRAFEVPFSAALAWEDQAQAVCLTTDDVFEGVTAFLEKRPPRFRGR